MTEFSIRDTERLRRRAGANPAMALPGGDFASDDRSVPIGIHLAVLLDAVASGAGLCLRRLLAALHESRSKQAAIERARYQHLIYDADTGVHFGTDWTARPRS
jgi:hypothetical protein